jgi:hypothetical protein
MKRLFLALFVVLMLTTSTWAAGTVTEATPVKFGSHMYRLTFSWVADASDGTVPAKTSSKGYEGYVLMMVTDPGGTEPTPDYDITLTDSNSIDTLGGAGADRSATATESAMPTVDTAGSTKGKWPIDGPITLNISNNDVHSATGTVYVYIYSDEPAVNP